MDTVPLVNRTATCLDATSRHRSAPALRVAPLSAACGARLVIEVFAYLLVSSLVRTGKPVEGSVDVLVEDVARHERLLLLVRHISPDDKSPRRRAADVVPIRPTWPRSDTSRESETEFQIEER